MRNLILLSFLFYAGNCNAFEQIGIASYYSTESGNITASGKKFKPKSENGAAHRFLPFGTKLKVTNLKNNKSINVVITDRGPYIKGRILDLYEHAAKKLKLSIGKVKIATVN